MKFINMAYQKYIILLIPLLLNFPKRINAQDTRGAFIMSSVGTIQNLSNNSMAVVFNSNSNCLNLQNGAPVLTGERGVGLFATNCKVDTKFNLLGILLFPNPVNSNTKVKFINTPPLDDDFVISIWSEEGFRLNAIKVKGYELYQGKLLDFSTLNAGTFIIQIESEKYIDALKFIKAK